MIQYEYHITELLAEMNREDMRKLRDWLSYQLGDSDDPPDWNIGRARETVSRDGFEAVVTF